MNTYTALLLLAAICFTFAAECPAGSGEDTYAFKEFKGVKGTVELNLKRGKDKTPPVIAVEVKGGEVKVEADEGGKKVDVGKTKGKDGHVHFSKPTETDKLYFTPEGTENFEVSVSVCYEF
ncbi:uncharacterized protein LOC135503005 [Lineus longissimus]|uniref:uncharacterized protein LOC135503005 n=1 Tax=Lineus longissimus TaxID=88925 RepID=UPI002B4F64DD